MKAPINIFWFRRDFRLEDNAGLYHALTDSSGPTLCVFIFDTSILTHLPETDHRVSFIHKTLQNIKKELISLGSDLLVLHNTPESAWQQIISNYSVKSVYTNEDYEPQARKRDKKIKNFLAKNKIDFHSFKDQVIFKPGEILTNEGNPYTVYTPFAKKWKQSLTEFFIKPYPNKKYYHNLLTIKDLPTLSLSDLGFKDEGFSYPSTKVNRKLLKQYHELRNFPAKDSTSKLGLHLRFGTVSVRKQAVIALQENETWLSELIWREFFMHLLYFFPKTVKEDFRPKVLAPVQWENNAKLFELWTQGLTGYPLVDAGMRELNATGFMHNRVRMLVASFLVKNLLIHWKYGERYFAEKLLDFDLSANIGNWQWCAGGGADAAPYFRIFNPNTQIEKFDPDYEYIKKWVPEFGTDEYPAPIVELDISRKRFLNFFKPKF